MLYVVDSMFSNMFGTISTKDYQLKYKFLPTKGDTQTNGNYQLSLPTSYIVGTYFCWQFDRASQPLLS